MNKFCDSLPSAIFWLAVCLFIWVQHTQYMAGHETILFVHKTPEEVRIREAQVRKVEAETVQAIGCK